MDTRPVSTRCPPQFLAQAILQTIWSLERISHPCSCVANLQKKGIAFEIEFWGPLSMFSRVPSSRMVGLWKFWVPVARWTPPETKVTIIFVATSHFAIKFSRIPAAPSSWPRAETCCVTREFGDKMTKIIITLVSGGVQLATGTQNFDKPTIRDDRTRKHRSQNSIFRTFFL